MNKLKIAVIGLGKMGLVHSCVLGTMPEVEVIAYCDKSSLLRKIAKKLFSKSEIVDDVKKLDSLSIDCAYVTAPIPAHYPIIDTLYSNNITKNVFVEKTLSSNFKEAERLCAMAENIQGVNMVGYMKRFGVTFNKAKNLLTENAIGELTSFDAFAYSSDFTCDSKVTGALSRGGVLSDLGSHIIDLASWFFGDFEVKEATIESVIDKGSEDTANFKVKTQNLFGEFNISWCKENYRMPNFGMTIQGTKGKLTVNDFTVVLQPTNGEQSAWSRATLNDNVPFLIGDPEYYREDDHFIKSVLNGNKAEPSFRTASKVDKIIEEAKREGL